MEEVRNPRRRTPCSDQRLKRNISVSPEDDSVLYPKKTKGIKERPYIDTYGYLIENFRNSSQMLRPTESPLHKAKKMVETPTTTTSASIQTQPTLKGGLNVSPSTDQPSALVPPTERPTNLVPPSTERSTDLVPSLTERSTNLVPTSTERPTKLVPPSTKRPTNLVPFSTERPTNLVPPTEQPTNLVTSSTERPTNLVPPTERPANLVLSSTEGPNHVVHIKSEPSDDELVDFRGLAMLPRRHTSLLEKACIHHPDLSICPKRSRRWHEFAYGTLGELLFFLTSTKLKDMTETACEHLLIIWEEAQGLGFDLSWLAPIVQSGLGSSYKLVSIRIHKKFLKKRRNTLQSELSVLTMKLADADKELAAAENLFQRAKEEQESFLYTNL